MTNSPEAKTVNTQMHMRVPYALNAPFRTIFKTAEWNSQLKVFIAKATTANLNKWQRFMESIVEATELLEQAELKEATAEELAKLAQAASFVVCELERRIAVAESKSADAKAKADEAREQAEVFRPTLQAAEDRLKETLGELEIEAAQRDAAIRPVLDLYKAHGLSTILTSYRRAANLDYRGKDARSQAQDDLEELRVSLLSIGFRVKALDELVKVSLNRPDNAMDAIDKLSRRMKTGIEQIAN